MLNNPFKKTIPQQRPKNEKCEVIIERKGDKIIKRIKGTCNKEQLAALSNSSDE